MIFKFDLPTTTYIHTKFLKKVFISQIPKITA